MDFRLSALAPVLLVTAACAQVPQKPATPPKPAAPAQAAAPARHPAAPVEAKPASPALPKQELTSQILYELLLGEIAGQRGHLTLASDAYLDLAKRTRDPRIAQRATEVALYSRLPQQALEAAKLWLDLAPDSEPARQTVAVLLVSAGKLTEARPYLEKLLAAEGGNPGMAFLRLNGLLAKQQDKKAVLELVTGLAKSYGQLPEAHFAVAQAAWAAGRMDLARSESAEAMKLRPDWEMGALFRGALLQQTSVATALAYYRDFLQRFPAAKEVRLGYARLLVNDKQFAAAREQFRQVLQSAPDSPEVNVAVGLLSMQLKDYDAAEDYLKRALALGYKDPDVVRLYLGQLNDERKRFPQALEWYGSIGPGPVYFSAQVRYAAVLAGEGKLAEGRKHLHQIVATSNQQRVQLIQAEAQLLREAHAYQEAYDVLSRALDKLPNQPDLLYDRAMAAEKINRLDVAEQDLRKLIQLKPYHAQAYNALGYTLADRTTRYKEALELISKALELAPGDPFIMDSMGWVQYRMGNYDKAVDFLKHAYAGRPDPEIAAHLGEVLWAQGKRDEAKKVWQDSLKENPDSEALLTVIKKFGQ